MRFCSLCGGELKAGTDAGNGPAYSCARCGTLHYDGPKVLVWCFAYFEQQLLMCRRAEAPARGKWNPPSGYVERGEALEEAAARELREETGVVIAASDMQLFRVVSIPHINQVFVGFRAPLTELPRLAPGPEVLEARFFAESAMPLAELAFRDGIAAAYPREIFEAIRTGRFPVFSAVAPAPLRHRASPELP